MSDFCLSRCSTVDLNPDWMKMRNLLHVRSRHTLDGLAAARFPKLQHGAERFPIGTSTGRAELFPTGTSTGRAELFPTGTSTGRAEFFPIGTFTSSHTGSCTVPLFLCGSPRTN